MRKFLFQVSVFLLASLLAIVAIDSYLLFTPTLRSHYSHERNALFAYNKLVGLMDTNKIVIIAGSNGAFSINSQLIHDAFNLPVVNTSTHAGIGIRLQFEMYKDFLKKGDIVVFCPEYGGGRDRLYGGSTTLRILSSQLPSAYSKISLLQWGYLHKYIGSRFKEIQNNGNLEDTIPAESPYSVKALNVFGDIECDRAHEDSIEFGEINGKMDDRLVNYIQYVHDYTRKKGILLVFLPPTLMKSAFVKNQSHIDSLVYCLKTNGIGWQAPPIRYSFADSLYYDTEYHMTQVGANLRTIIMIEDMKRILKWK